jgi:hypothetical protein
LAPAVEKVGDVFLEGLETDLAVSLRIEDLSSEGEHALHPPGRVDQPLEQTLAGRRDRLPQLADLLVPPGTIELGCGTHSLKRLFDVLEGDFEFVGKPVKKFQALFRCQLTVTPTVLLESVSVYRIAC